MSGDKGTVSRRRLRVIAFMSFVGTVVSIVVLGSFGGWPSTSGKLSSLVCAEDRDKGTPTPAAPLVPAVASTPLVSTPTVAQPTRVGDEYTRPDEYGLKRWMTSDYSCTPPWYLKLPDFNEERDRFHWFNDTSLRRPFLGCPIINETLCRYKGGCSNYQVTYNTSVKEENLGSCGNHPILDVDQANPEFTGDVCDNRTFVPMKVPQGAYFAHWLDNVMPRLVRVLLREPKPHGNIVVFIERKFISKATIALVQALNITLVHEFPTQCFRKVVWACHSLFFDPFTAKLISRVVREPFAERRIDNGIAPPKKCTRRIYAARVHSVKNGRLVMNDLALSEMLHKKYNFRIFTGAESLETWADALSDACVFMGSHGGALAHVFWLDAALKPLVIELDGYKKYGIYWAESAALDIQYVWQHFNATVGVELDRMESMLQRFGIQPEPTSADNIFSEETKALFPDTSQMDPFGEAPRPKSGSFQRRREPPHLLQVNRKRLFE